MIPHKDLAGGEATPDGLRRKTDENSAQTPDSNEVVQDLTQDPLLAKPALRTATRSGSGAGWQDTAEGSMMQPDELRALRKAAGMSQAALAEAIGMTRESIGHMERGNPKYPIEKRTELAVRYVVEVTKQ